jgi:hypothetical protein
LDILFNILILFVYWLAFCYEFFKKILQYLALHPAFHLLFVLHCFALYERENYLVQKFLPRSPVPYFFEGLTSFSKADFFLVAECVACDAYLVLGVHTSFYIPQPMFLVTSTVRGLRESQRDPFTSWSHQPCQIA